jgi:lipid A 3-O-deacylase
MKMTMIVLGLALSSLLPLTAQAQHSFWLAPGVTSEGGMTANIGISRDWELRWFETGTGYLGGYWHAGYTWWEGGRAGDAAHSISFSPVLVYTFNSENWRPFLELGIGAALFSRSLVGDKNLGSSAHFEDRFSAGVFLGERDRLMFRVIHYSNAGFASPNQGIESWSLVWGRSF